MGQETIAAIISGVVGISVAIIGKNEIWNRSNNRLVKKIELYSLLPSESKSKSSLLATIDSEVIARLHNESKRTRSMTGMILGILFVLSGAYLSWFFIREGSWWLVGLVVSIFMVILGLVGFIQDVSKTERDDKGRPIKNVKL